MELDLRKGSCERGISRLVYCPTEFNRDHKLLLLPAPTSELLLCEEQDH